MGEGLQARVDQAYSLISDNIRLKRKLLQVKKKVERVGDQAVEHTEPISTRSKTKPMWQSTSGEVRKLVWAMHLEWNLQFFAEHGVENYDAKSDPSATNLWRL
ncbi:hypothetical protein Fot_06189 [Forsythia ovata]|uniref:Uncharacterized protein n=1 Tax=Forsythia ovata TaxID=205694 RepID=A0ABD1NXJ2_9LAMI